MIFYCRFELPEAFTTRIHQKNMQKPSKKAKKTVQVPIFFPKKAKVLLLFPPPIAETCLLYMGDFLTVQSKAIQVTAFLTFN